MTQFSLGNLGEAPAQQGHEQAALLTLLMDRVAQHVVEEDQEELGRFHERVATETDRVKQAAGHEEMKPPVEAFIHLLAQHNEAIASDHRAHAAELTKALRMMTETIGVVGRSSQAAVHQLGVIEKNLEEVTGTEDAKSLRLKLGVCLKMIRDQSESLQAQSSEHLNQLKAFVASSSAAKPVELLEEPLDSVTGLPNRSFAENLIGERLAQKADCLIGIVRVNRLSNLLTRYGQTTVDDVMKTATRLLAQRLPVGTTLCRWSQNSFVAIMDITSTYGEALQQWQKVGSVKVEKNIDGDSRAAYVVLTTSVTMEHLRATASKRNLTQSLDRFVTQAVGE